MEFGNCKRSNQNKNCEADGFGASDLISFLEGWESKQSGSGYKHYKIY